MMHAVEHAQDESATRSPGLDHFRKNPFRALRLPQSATVQQALWQGEKILARVRSGGPIPDPDPVPWLAPATELEIMDALQTVETPLAHLVEQLLWFDFDNDPRGPELREALATEHAGRLHAYLYTVSDEPLVARINQVNLRLLLGFSQLRGVGPRVLPANEPGTAAPSWDRADRFEVIDDLHVAIRARRALGESWSEMLGDALLAWGRLLKYPNVLDDLRARLVALEMLGDERVTADDVEAVSKAIWTRLADLVVGEARLELQRGITENAARLVALAGKSEIEAEIWLVASRPLRAQFQLELAALAPAAVTGDGQLADIRAYLDRLGALIARWRSIDARNLLGLATLVDEVVAEAFDRLRALELKQRRGEDFVQQVKRIAELAASKSIRERVTSYLDQLQRERYSVAALATCVCQFCRKRDGSLDHAALVTARETTERDRKKYITLQAWPVARCEVCARLHRRIIGTGHLMFLCCLAALAMFILLVPMEIEGKIMVGVLGIAMTAVVRTMTRFVAIWQLTPAGDRKLDYVEDSDAMFAARDSNTGRLGSIAYDERYQAWARAQQNKLNEFYGRPMLTGLAKVFGTGTTLMIFWLSKALLMSGVVLLQIRMIDSAVAWIVAVLIFGLIYAIKSFSTD